MQFRFGVAPDENALLYPCGTCLYPGVSTFDLPDVVAEEGNVGSSSSSSASSVASAIRSNSFGLGGRLSGTTTTKNGKDLPTETLPTVREKKDQFPVNDNDNDNIIDEKKYTKEKKKKKGYWYKWKKVKRPSLKRVRTAITTTTTTTTTKPQIDKISNNVIPEDGFFVDDAFYPNDDPDASSLSSSSLSSSSSSLSSSSSSPSIIRSSTMEAKRRLPTTRAISDLLSSPPIPSGEPISSTFCTFFSGG